MLVIALLITSFELYCMTLNNIIEPVNKYLLNNIIGPVNKYLLNNIIGPVNKYLIWKSNRLEEFDISVDHL